MISLTGVKEACCRCKCFKSLPLTYDHRDSDEECSALGVLIALGVEVLGLKEAAKFDSEWMLSLLVE